MNSIYMNVKEALKNPNGINVVGKRNSKYEGKMNESNEHNDGILYYSRNKYVFGATQCTVAKRRDRNFREMYRFTW